MRVFLSILLLVLLAAASVAAIFVIADLEREPPVIGRPEVTRAFSPDGNGEIDTATVTIEVARRDRVDVRIVDEDEHTVDTLARNESVRGKTSWTWDGTTTSGDRAAEGDYRMKVHVRGRDRTVLVPTTIAIDVTPPTIHAFDIDDSRAKLGVVRVKASSSGADNHHVQVVNGDTPTVLETIRFLRSSDERAKPGKRDDFRLSARLPKQTTVGDSNRVVTLEFVAKDDAGNQTRRSFRFPVPPAVGNARDASSARETS